MTSAAMNGHTEKRAAIAEAAPAKVALEVIPDDLVSLKEATRLAKCHLATLYRWREQGVLRAWRRVGRLYVSRRELLGLFKPTCVRPEPAVAITEAEHDAWVDQVFREHKLRR